MQRLEVWNIRNTFNESLDWHELKTQKDNIGIIIKNKPILSVFTFKSTIFKVTTSKFSMQDEIWQCEIELEYYAQ